MLDGLGDIDWTSFADAYGPATAVPALLSALAAGDGAADALCDLQNRINHQGTVTPAVAPAAPFIVALVQAAIAPRAELLRFVGDLACGGDHANVALEPAAHLSDPVQVTLARAVPSAVLALADADAHVRAAAAIPIAFLGDVDARAALLAAAGGEKKAEVLATFLLALAVMHQRLGALADAADVALFERARKGRAALSKLVGSLALAQVTPTSDHAVALIELAHPAKEIVRGVPWYGGELRALGLRLGARILAASGDVERLMTLEAALGPEPVWRMVLQIALGHDGWSGPSEPYLASDLDARQTRIVRALAERQLALAAAAARGKGSPPPLGVFGAFGLFAVDRLMGLAPPGPRDACPRAEPLWRTAWRSMRAGTPDATWHDALADLDAAQRMALALDLLDLRDGATFPPMLERSYGESGRYATGRRRLVAATLAGVPADIIAPHITRTDLSWTQAPLVSAWVRALVTEGRAVPADADPILMTVLGRLDDDPSIARTLVSALPIDRRDAVAGGLELNLIVSDDRPRALRAAFFRIGWHVVDLVPALYARALLAIASWIDVPGPSAHERTALAPMIEAEVATRLARAPELARAQLPKALATAQPAGARIFRAALASLDA